MSLGDDYGSSDGVIATGEAQDVAGSTFTVTNTLRPIEVGVEKRCDNG